MIKKTVTSDLENQGETHEYPTSAWPQTHNPSTNVRAEASQTSPETAS